jgi:hypothetical protein
MNICVGKRGIGDPVDPGTSKEKNNDRQGLENSPSTHDELQIVRLGQHNVKEKRPLRERQGRE